MLNQTVVAKYFKYLKQLIDNTGLLEKPSNIWNCDECVKQFEHDPVRVGAEKGMLLVEPLVTGPTSPLWPALMRLVRRCHPCL